MEQQFCEVEDNLNKYIIRINQLLLHGIEENDDIRDSVANYYSEILNDENNVAFELKFPYFGIKEGLLYTAKVVSSLGCLIKELSRLKYNNKELNDTYLLLLNAERQMFITFCTIFFEPFSWEKWQEFASEKLKLRSDLILTVILAIRLLQEDYPEEVLDEFQQLDTVEEAKKYEILDFMANNHLEQRYIYEYFINRIVNNFAEVINNRLF